MKIQQYIERMIITMSLVSFAAMFNAEMDTVNFHFSTSIFSEKNEQYFNPKLSWQNKWKIENGEVQVGKERFPGSSTIFVKFTDYWHLTQSMMLLCFFLAIVAYNKPTQKKGYLIIIDIILLSIIFSLTFTLFFDYFLINS